MINGNLWRFCWGLGFLLSGAACTGPLTPEREIRTNWPPLYQSASDKTGDSYGVSALLNLVRLDRGPDHAYTHCIPFYFHDQEGSDNDFTLVPPFYYHRKRLFEEDRFFLLWGSSRRGAKTDYYGLYPFLRYSDFEAPENRWEAYFFPLLDYRRDQDRHHLKALNVTGFFTLLDLEWGIPPANDGYAPGGTYSFLNVLNLFRLFGGGDPGGYDDFELLTFLSSVKLSFYQYHWTKDDPQTGHTVLFPLYWHARDAESESLHFWPFYGRERSQNGIAKDHFIYPLFSYMRDEVKSRWIVDSPWPLFRFMRGENGDSETRLMPFFCKASTEQSDLLAVTPLYWRCRDRKNDDYAFDLLFPLFARYGYGEEDQTLSFLPLFKMLWDRPKEPKPGRSQVDLLWPLASYGSLKDRTAAWLFPLFAYEADTKFVEWRFLLDILGFKTEGSRTTMTLFWLFPISWGGEERGPSEEEK
ncbi:MAG: hypothetical protein KJ645_01300 [Planctomycetes bacterium]|nr:hypothetical protein [Planctomycetota bacterium]